MTFKDWEEINGELNRALSFFPSPVLMERDAPFDLRRAEDRDLINLALTQADQGQVLRSDSLDQNYVLLTSYLEGYANLQDLLTADRSHLELTGSELARHQRMVTHEAEAVFLKDVLLTLPFPWAAPGLELVDCQGSDSLIPQHMAQVQNYLLKTDLLLYVISSRVGLRQADFKFLADIKRLRLWDNTLFILNLDLGEHDNLQEARNLIDRVRRELRVFQADTPIFAFSALDLLLTVLKTKGLALSPKDRSKLENYELDVEATGFFRQEAAKFRQELQHLINTRQFHFLLSGCLAQIQTVSQGIKENAQVQYELLGQDLASFRQAEDWLAQRRQALEGVLHSLSRALGGASEELKKKLRRKISLFFDSRHGEVGPPITHFIKQYQDDLDSLELSEQLSAFMPGLYNIYQRFQQQLWKFLTEEINLRIMEFVKIQENWVQEELTKVIKPLLDSMQDALNLYYQEISVLGVSAPAPVLSMVVWTHPEKLQPRLFSLELSLNWRVRSEALLHLGINLVRETLGRLKKRCFKGSEEVKQTRLRKSLADALVKIKAQASEETSRYLVDYSEGMKFQYFFPLMEYLAKEQETGLHTTLGSLMVDLAGIKEAMLQQEDRKSQWRRGLQGVVEKIWELDTARAALRSVLEKKA
jgi:hypothetical protein